MRSWLLAVAVLASCAGSDRHVPPQPQPQPVVVVDAAVAVADAAPPPDAARLDRDPPRLAARDLAMLQAVASALGDAGSDCAAGTTKLVDVRAEFSDVVIADAAMLGDERRAALKAALATRRADVAAAAQAVFQSAALTACANDPDFERAFDRALGQP
jgi:hypothetical protein